MPYIRRLPSGKWQATVRLPSGKKTSRTDPLKRVVAEWGKAEDTRIARGEWRDARSGRVGYEEWRDRWHAARVVEPETARRDRSLLTNHLDPQWSGWRLPAISRIEVQGWVKRMHTAGVGPHAIRHAYTLLSTMLGGAVEEGILSESPCRRISLPATPPKMPEWFTHAEVEAIAAELAERHAAAANLMAWCGLRWGEMAGLRIGRITFLRRRLAVDGVNTQDGQWKEYPKTSKSRREVAVPPGVLELLAPLAVGRGPGELLFTTVRTGRPWSGSNWRHAWYAAIDAARAAQSERIKKTGVTESEIPRFSPHALRHTAASWLVQDGVPLYDVQAFLGHESVNTTAKYAHLAPDAHGAIERAWRRMDRPGEDGQAAGN